MRYDYLIASLQNLMPDKQKKEFAEMLGISKQNLSNKIANKSIVASDTLQRLKDTYKIEINENNIFDDDCFNITVRGDVNASMGYGVTVYDETKTGTYQISKKLANDLGIFPEKTEMIFASGDSMLPTIEGGDSLLIDLNRKEIYDGRIYCVRIDGQLYAKRLQKIPPSKVIVISDNQKYQSFEIDFSKQVEFDFEVIGEVRWWGRVAR